MNQANPTIKLPKNALTLRELTNKAETIRPEGNILATQAPPKEYTVTHGDTLWKIAEREYGTGYAWTKIAQTNKLANPNLIFSGNVLNLPRI